MAEEPPTLFVTCSCAEWYSDSLISYLRNINSSVPGIESMTPAEVCAMDPVNVSIHFHKKWDTIFNQLILSKDHPIFGHVQDYVYRIEYQTRGLLVGDLCVYIIYERCLSFLLLLYLHTRRTHNNAERRQTSNEL